jgi:hypothetical protein
MDVDGDPDTTQHAREVEDYGLEIDFSSVDEDDLEVRLSHSAEFSTNHKPRYFPPRTLGSATKWTRKSKI